MRVIEEDALYHEAATLDGTFSKLARFIKNGAFGDPFVLICASTQIQLAAVHLNIGLLPIDHSLIYRRLLPNTNAVRF